MRREHDQGVAVCRTTRCKRYQVVPEIFRSCAAGFIFKSSATSGRLRSRRRMSAALSASSAVRQRAQKSRDKTACGSAPGSNESWPSINPIHCPARCVCWSNRRRNRAPPAPSPGAATSVMAFWARPPCSNASSGRQARGLAGRRRRRRLLRPGADARKALRQEAAQLNNAIGGVRTHNPTVWSYYSRFPRAGKLFVKIRRILRQLHGQRLSIRRQSKFRRNAAEGVKKLFLLFSLTKLAI